MRGTWEILKKTSKGNVIPSAIIFPQTLACKQRSCVGGVDPGAVG
jgi:hypothetical protein